MGVLYVARSADFSDWASDVGLSKNVYKVGYTDEPIDPIIAAGWGGTSDWKLVKKHAVEGLDEARIMERLARKEKMIDPNYYPRLKGATGIFKVSPEHVENHIIVTKSIAGGELPKIAKLKPTDFADYIIHNALR
jgi:hypothetical protein